MERHETRCICKEDRFCSEKSAHACEYAALSVLFFVNYKKKSRKIKQIVGMSALSTALYAVTDEIHQLFVPGRSGQITDVILDSCGGLIGGGSVGNHIIPDKKEEKRWKLDLQKQQDFVLG